MTATSTSTGRSPARPTIYDVARAAGVSKSLVSLVLQGSERVSEARRTAVLRAIDELGYRPSAAAASLASSRTRSIGVVVDDFENLWYVDLLRGMRDVLNEPGFHVSVADRNLNAHLDLDPVDGFIARGVEGLVVAAEPHRARLETVDVPVVVVGGREGVPPAADVVANDDAAGARLATEHLVGLGHTAIGHLTGAGGAAALRREAYCTVMRESGLSPVVVGDSAPTSEETGYQVTRDLLAEHPDVTAIFAANDTMALGALAALRERGLVVPDDVSVVGYDNSPLASSRYLSLTTVDDRSAEVGVEAARALLSRISHPDRETRHVLLEPELIRRSSTAARG